MCALTGQQLNTIFHVSQHTFPTLTHFFNFTAHILEQLHQYLYNRKSASFYKFLLKIYPHYSFYITTHFRNCYSNRAYLHDYCSFYFILFFYFSYLISHMIISPLSSDLSLPQPSFFSYLLLSPTTNYQNFQT